MFTRFQKLKNEILRTLNYFDIFKYPLTLQEISDYLSHDCSQDDLKRELNTLIKQQRLFEIDGLYLLHDDENLVKKRRISNKLAKDIMPRALEMGRFIGSFPFVSSVSLSGSISKNVMFKDSDIDFFIITEYNRLWISRLLLVLYKRIFLLNSRKQFCINYFITKGDLKIPDCNIFTAVETSTLIPVTGLKTFEDFIRENDWTRKYIFKSNQFEPSTVTNVRKKWWAKILEIVLFDRLADSINGLIRKSVEKRNQIKYSKYRNDPNFDLMFRSKKEQSKIHKLNHQTKVLNEYNKRVELLSNIDKVRTQNAS